MTSWKSKNPYWTLRNPYSFSCRLPTCHYSADWLVQLKCVCSSNVCVGTPFFIMPWLMAVVCHVYAGRLWTRTRKIFKTGSEPAGTLKPCRFLYTALECFIISNCSVPYTDSKNIHTTDHLSFMAKTSWLYHNISQIMLSKSIIWTLRLTYNVELSPQLKSGYLCLCISQWMSWLALCLKPEWGNPAGFNGR